MPGPREVDRVGAWMEELQDRLCRELERLDGQGEFRDDRWSRDEGAGIGSSRLLAGGALLEKAGVNFSRLRGDRLPAAASRVRPELAGRDFEVMGVSLVVHPVNPYVPGAHFNVRLFVAGVGAGEPVWWFGGGFDMTPVYGFREDAVHWHRTARSACEPFGPDLYPRLKRWCDEYFYLPHRGEARGVGGLFFDDWNEAGFETSYALAQSIAEHFLPAWIPIAERRRGSSYGERERSFQLYRRGRYVEFNLIYDRGTRFGLESGGRAESILMSLPPQAAWPGDLEVEPGSPEASLVDEFLTPRDWLGEE